MVYAYGGCFTMEHPRSLEQDPDKWGIWNSGWVRWLLAHDVGLLTFLQGPLGTAYPKPTSMLHGRLPGFASAIFGAYDTSWRYTELLGGKTDDGKGWRTSKAKTYPTRLCEILATQCAWYSQNVVRKGIAEEIDGLQGILETLAAPWDPYSQDQSMEQMLHDFQADVFD